jgi:hypothetical protein
MRSGRYPFNLADTASAVVVPGGYARNIRAIKADVRELAITKLGQLGNITLIITEGPDHADERE